MVSTAGGVVVSIDVVSVSAASPVVSPRADTTGVPTTESVPAVLPRSVGEITGESVVVGTVEATRAVSARTVCKAGCSPDVPPPRASESLGLACGTFRVVEDVVALAVVSVGAIVLAP